MAERVQPLVIFDFDRSLCTEADTDDYVCEKLLPEEKLREMCDQYLPGWHNVINHMLGLIKKKGLTTADVEKCLSSLVIPTAVVDTVKQVHDDLGYNVYILSDANTFWIDNVLKGSHCEKYIDKIMTNYAKYDEVEDLLVIEPFYSGPAHGCPNLCGTNMCKGREINNILATENRPRIVYVGDGKNDFCAVEKLRKFVLRCIQNIFKTPELNQVCARDDLVFARDGYALATKLRGVTEGIQATIFYWASSPDLVDLFRSHIICA